MLPYRKGARVIIFGLSLHLLPYFVCVSSKGSGEYETAALSEPSLLAINIKISCAGPYKVFHGFVIYH